MKRIILTFVAVTVMLFSTNAQTKKGTILLGAGSSLSGVALTDLSITPKVGYFIQDGLAIGAMVSFWSDDRTHQAYAGDYVANPNVPGGVELINDNAEYTLTNNARTYGVFARYYAARNLFLEVNMLSETTQDEGWDTWEQIVPIAGTDQFTVENVQGIEQSRTQTTHVAFGMGYTLVWREHFAVEPYIHLDLIVDGEDVSPGSTVDVAGTSFIAGINMSLFF